MISAEEGTGEIGTDGGSSESQPVELPPEWEQTANDAPMTAETFRAMTLSDWIGRFGALVRENMRAPVRLCGKLCALLMLAAVVQGFCAGRVSAELGALVEAVSALAVFAVCAAPLLGLTDALRQVVETSRTYILSFVPVFASVLTACGQPGSATLYSSLFLGICTVMADVLCRVGVPIARMLLAMHAAGTFSGTPALSQACGSLCKWINWLMSFFAMVFGALMSLQSIFAQSADTLALRTGKFLVSSSVPVVGGAISDAMGSVLASMRLAKGTVGFAAIAVVMSAFLPLIDLCAIYHLVLSLGNFAACAVGSTKNAALLTGLADCVKLYISMSFFYSLLLTMGTLVMVLLGNGGI